MTIPNLQPSLMELALKSHRAMVMGVGGGGDAILTIPIANYLSSLGVKAICVGGVNCQWWTPKGEPFSNAKGTCLVGPMVYDISRLTDGESWAPMVVGVKATSSFEGRRPPEAAICESVKWDAFVAGLSQGVVGLRDSLRQVVAKREIDLFVGVDCGSDSFHDGNEVGPAHTSLVDFMSLSAMIQLDCPVVYAVAGYGCDDEMEVEEQDERVARVMKAGGFLGAHGFTQRDVNEMMAACALFPDPIEELAIRAAQGELGLRFVPVDSPWGRRVRVTPLAAVMLFFDPRVMVEQVSIGVSALRNTKSLTEAEKIYEDELGQLPETALKQVVNFLR